MPLTPYALVSQNNTSDATIVPGTLTGSTTPQGSGEFFIAVSSVVLTAASAVTATFYDGPSSGANALLEIQFTADNLTFVLPMATQNEVNGREFYFYTKAAIGNSLVLKLGGSVAVTGLVNYQFVTQNQ